MSQEQEVPKVPINKLSNGFGTSPEENSSLKSDETTAGTASRSEPIDISVESSQPADSLRIKFEDWGFKIDRLFEVAHRFYKRNESKAFQPTFDVRNQMNALILQAKYGDYDETKIPDVGLLDLIGKSRRKEWAQLREMSRVEAMSKFICTLDEICPFFKAHTEAVKISSHGSHLVDGVSISNSNSKSTVNSTRLDEIEAEDQLKAIHTSLCRQTYHQFKSYAEQQYPHETDKQRYLITTLQEQYYQQYISQMHPNLKANIKITEQVATGPDIAKESSDAIINHDGNKPSNELQTVVKTETLQATCSSSVAQVPPPDDIVQYSSSPDCTGHARQLDITYQPKLVDLEQQLKEETIDPGDDDNSDYSGASGSPLQGSITYEPLEPASIWMKKGVREFKESLLNDKHGGSYVVKQGTLLTIQVPTYPGGRFIHWEFVTDDYDIGFGLEFLNENNLEQPLALKFHEETDEDDFDDEEAALDEALNQRLAGESQLRPDVNLNGVHYGTEAEAQKRDKVERIANTMTIVPTYRRDSHEEVFVGRHRYPGQGYYMLKFDNTYSVLRSKTLYFRICFFV